MLNFNPAISLFSSTFAKRLFSSSSLSAIWVVSSAYLKLLIFLLANLITAWDSFNMASHTIYPAYKLNKLHKRRRFHPWVGKIPWRRARQPTPVFLGFPCGSAGKEYACNAGDLGLIPGLGRSPGEGKGYTLQYSGLENSMDYTVANSQTWMRDFDCVHYVLAKLFHLLPRFVIAFLPRSKCLHVFMAAVIIHSDFGAQEKKIRHCFHFSSCICHEVMGLDAMILCF